LSADDSRNVVVSAERSAALDQTASASTCAGFIAKQRNREKAGAALGQEFADLCKNCDEDDKSIGDFAGRQCQDREAAQFAIRDM